MTARPLLLVGAGGFARETAELARMLEGTFRLVGLLDDNPALRGRVVGGAEVLGPLEAVHDHPDAAVTVCIASPARREQRRSVVERLGLPPHRYATLVHPTAVVPRSARIGPGTVVHATTVLTADVVLGAHCAVMPAVVLTHDDVVEDHVTFGAGVRLAGGVRVGECAYLGSGALVREERRIGASALVGMGAVVVDDVPAGEVWAGVPARRLERDARREPPRAVAS